MTKNYIYIHICTINNWENIFDNIVLKIKDSKLYEKIEEIRCCVLGKIDVLKICEKDEKIKIIYSSKDIKLKETKILNLMIDDSKKSNEEYNILYLHTKGVTRHNNLCVKDWVDYMLYFNLYKHEDIFELLKDNDTVGVNLINKIQIHYSGNFWWSKSSHIKTKMKIIDDNYHSPEFWVTNSKGSFISLWNSGYSDAGNNKNCIHYNQRYNETNYKNKDINIYKMSCS